MADTYNLKLEQGADFALALTLRHPTTMQPLNLTSASVAAHLRETVSAPLAAAFTCSVAEPPTSGTILLTLNHSTTAALTGSCMLYDIEVTQYDVVTRVLQGKATLSKEVTR